MALSRDGHIVGPDGKHGRSAPDPELHRVSAIVVGGDVASGPLPQRTIAQLVAMGTRLRRIKHSAPGLHRE
jgi:hypothetical protein